MSSSQSTPPSSSLLPPPSSPSNVMGESRRMAVKKNCNIFAGEWIPNPEAPYYTNDTCEWAIYDHQNCMKYGRPDSDFMKWRWKPNDCELPIFDPSKFLALVRGKSLAFVGDSVARNQMQSLLCLLSKVEKPVDVSTSPDEQSRRWQYTNYNFTIANFWSPYLVKTGEADPMFPSLFSLYLDEFDDSWTSKIHEFDYVIISAGHWFFRPAKYFMDSQLIGCHYCADKNVTQLDMHYSYGKAFRTAFRAMNSLKNSKGITFLRTFAPSHFENGEWNKGGDCVRRKPLMSNETHLGGTDLEMYMAQVEEFKVAEGEGSKRGLKFRLLDTTNVMLLRPDGHPSQYGHLPEVTTTWHRDCVHWCLPGPIDTWNDFLLEMLDVEYGIES
ncbi:trichome birefringence-like [Thalictrum thalictroides]|uniref:Trichome birefringence-like n=1 Tax=Thalictrum thalictroides TaxID=46969 RepID=A0A7J6XDY1_THATH|nr:trichome birefringence-like [Thalictrum thalictroides]